MSAKNSQNILEIYVFACIFFLINLCYWINNTKYRNNDLYIILIVNIWKSKDIQQKIDHGRYFFYESDVIAYASITKCPFPKSVTTDGSLMYADVCKHNRSPTLYKIKYFYLINWKQLLSILLSSAWAFCVKKQKKVFLTYEYIRILSERVTLGFTFLTLFYLHPYTGIFLTILQMINPIKKRKIV